MTDSIINSHLHKQTVQIREASAPGRARSLRRGETALTARFAPGTEKQQDAHETVARSGLNSWEM